MTDTAFQVPKESADRFSSNYSPNPAGGLVINEAATRSRYLLKPAMCSGGGGLVSTARDYIRFCQMMLNQGELDGNRILKTATVQSMTKDQLPKIAFPISLGGERPGVGFGLGFSVAVKKPTPSSPLRIGEYGWGGAASTHAAPRRKSRKGTGTDLATGNGGREPARSERGTLTLQSIVE